MSTILTTGVGGYGNAGYYPQSITVSPSNTVYNGVGTWQTTYSGIQNRGNEVILCNTVGAEILRVNLNGDVIWASHIKIDEAAQALATAMSLGVEFSAGFKNNLKGKIRDRVFEEIINMSKESGFLTTKELTNIFEASKIMEKLKGIE